MLAALLVSAAPAEAAGATVFINEIHYQNDGVDTGEGIEVAGPAGTSLDGWSLVLYRGDGTVYGTTLLSGTIPDQQNGYGTLAWIYPDETLGDGLDGVALVAPGDNVIQFLSYGLFGPLTAVDGPATGNAQSIIANEPPDTLVGTSLQLGLPFGETSGTAYDDFAWDTAKPHTFGDINGLQTFGTSATNQKGDVRDDLVALLGTGSAEDDEAIQKAILRIDQSLDPAFWSDANTPHPVEGKNIFDRERQAVIALGKVGGPVAEAAAAAGELADIDRGFAAAAIEAAYSGGGDEVLIAAAEADLASGDSHATAGNYAKAVEHYRKAWQDAVAAL